MSSSQYKSLLYTQEINDTDSNCKHENPDEIHHISHWDGSCQLHQNEMNFKAKILTCEGISGAGSGFGLLLRLSTVFDFATFALSCLKNHSKH